MTKGSIKVLITELKKAKKNREVTELRVRKLAEDILENGLKHPITINGQGVIIEGHHRVEAMLELGETHIEAFVSENLTEDDVASFNGEQKEWTNVDYMKQRGNYEFVSKYENIGITATTLEIMLFGGSNRIFSKHSIDKNSIEKLPLVETFVEEVWLKIFESLTGKIKSHQKLIRGVFNLYISGKAQPERIVSSIIRDYHKITPLFRMEDVKIEVVKSYNHGLRKKQIEVTTTGRII